MITYYKYIKDNPLFYNDVEIAKYGDIIVYNPSKGYRNITTGVSINTQAAIAIGLEGTLDIAELSPAFNIDTENSNGDNVNHPKHYTKHPSGIECIDAMLSAYGIEAVKNFCICNSFKYLWRFQHKNGIEDLNKLVWYINKFICNYLS